jgi:hypothetical protein
MAAALRSNVSDKVSECVLLVESNGAFDIKLVEAEKAPGACDAGQTAASAAVEGKSVLSTSQEVTNMAIGVVYGPSAMTAKQYKESWAGGPPLAPPPGLIFHAGIGEGPDFFTVSVWDSTEAYEAFAPMFAKAMSDMGFQFGAPQILPVHHFLQPSGH